LQHPYLNEQELEGEGTSEAERQKRLVETSGKLSFLKTFLPKLKERGHRVLLFSQVSHSLEPFEASPEADHNDTQFKLALDVGENCDLTFPVHSTDLRAPSFTVEEFLVGEGYRYLRLVRNLWEQVNQEPPINGSSSAGRRDTASPETKGHRLVQHPEIRVLYLHALYPCWRCWNQPRNS
jgi:hypothetical protein